MLIENDVRLMRRILVMRQFKEDYLPIVQYLQDKGIQMVLPDDQSKEQKKNFTRKLPESDKWLADKFGCIFLIHYSEPIFLNSMWANPRTLYIRLVEEIPELGELGVIHYHPAGLDIDELRAKAEKDHFKYRKVFPLNPDDDEVKVIATVRE